MKLDELETSSSCLLIFSFDSPILGNNAQGDPLLPLPVIMVQRLCHSFHTDTSPTSHTTT